MKIQRKLLVVFMFSVFALSACQGEEDPKPAAAVTANAGADKRIQLGETVTLDGSASRDSQGTPLAYQWSIVTKPANSIPVLSATNIATPVLAVDLDGVYELELAVSNEHGTHKDKVAITVVYTPVILSNITAKTVLEDRTANPHLADYWVNEDIGVDAELIVKPGVVIGFAEDAAMFVNSDGSISAKGEPNRTITFTGKSNRAGFWRGIMVYSSKSVNEFFHAEILNAGSSVMISSVKAGITVTEGAKLSIKNSHIDWSGGYGVYYMEGSIITGFQSNTISNNSEAPLLMTADHAAKVDGASSLSNGNGRNAVEVVTSFLTGNSEVTWQALADNTPYRFVGTIVAQTGLKLSPGVTIEIAPDNHFEIGDGYLNAVGTAAKKITITGVDKTASSWKGIIIYSASNLNIMDNVDISYAANDVLVSGIKASIVVSHTGKLTVKNSTISHSGGYGIFVNGAEVTVNSDAATANSFIDNAMEAIHYLL